MQFALTSRAPREHSSIIFMTQIAIISQRTKQFIAKVRQFNAHFIRFNETDTLWFGKFMSEMKSLIKNSRQFELHLNEIRDF